MSETIDRKVVEMRFDNQNFEKNVSQTIETSRRLDEALNGLGKNKAIEQLNENIKKSDLSPVSDGIEEVKAKFSSLQVVGMTVLSKLTDKAMTMTKSLWDNTLGQISSGGEQRALNLEQAKFQIEGLGESWAKVEKDVSYGVKDTAYGLDAAAKVASQLLASQIQVGDEMKTSLRGISGVAAMTSSSYEEIGNIFTKIAGNGRIMGQELLQLSGKGINAAATLAKALGTTEQKVREMVSKGQIDFRTFAKAMDDAFGQHAKEANKTYEGSLANMKAALSRIGAEVKSVKLETMRKEFNAITPVIDKVHKALMPLIDVINEGIRQKGDFIVSLVNRFGKSLDKPTVSLEKWQSLTEKGIVTKPFQKALKNAARESGVNIDKLIKKNGSFKKSLKDGWLNIDIFKKALSSYDKKMSDSAKGTHKVTGSLKELNKIANKVIRGDFGNGVTRMNALKKAGYDYATIQSLVNHKLLGTKVNLDKLSDSQLKNQGYSKKEIKAMRQLAKEAEKTGTPLNELMSELNRPTLFESFIGFLASIGRLFNKTTGALGKALTLVFGIAGKGANTVDSLTDVFIHLANVINGVADNTDLLTTILTGVITVFDILRTVAVTTFNFIKEVVVTVLGLFGISVIEAAEFVTNLVVKLRDWIRESTFLQDSAKKTAYFIKNVIDRVIELYNGIKDKVLPIIDIIKSKSKEIINYFKDVFKEDDGPKVKVFESLTGEFDKTEKKSKTFVQSMKDTFSDLGDWLKNFFKNVDLNTIISIVAVVGIMVVIIKLLNTISTFAGPLTPVMKVINNVGGILFKLKQSIKYHEMYLVAKSIALIAASIFALAMVPQGRMWGAVGAIAALLGALTAIAKFIDPTNLAGLTSLGYAMLAVAGSAFILAKAIRVLDDVEVNEELVKKIKLLGYILGALTILAIVMSKLKLYGTAGLTGIISLTAGVLAMAFAIKIISEIPYDKASKAIDSLIVIIGAIVVLYVVIAAAGPFATVAGKNILLIVVSLLLMTIVIKKCAKMAEDVPSALLGITGLGVIIVAIITTLKLANKYAGDIKDASRTIFAIGAAFLMIAIALKIIKTIDWGAVGKGVVVAVGFGVVMGALIAVTKHAGKEAKTVAATLLSFAAAMVILAICVKLLGTLDIGVVLQGTVCIIAIGVLIYWITKISERASKVGIANLIIITLALVILADVAINLGKIDPTKMAVGLGAVISLAGLTMLLMYISQYAEKIDWKSFTAIVLAVAVLGGVAFLLGQVNPTKLWQGVAAVGIMSLIVVGLLAVTGLISESGLGYAAIIPLIVMTLVIGAFALIVAKLSELKNVDKTIIIIQSMGKALLEISASMVLLGLLVPITALAIAGLVPLTIFIGGLILLFMALGEISKVPGLQWFIKEGSKVLSALGYAIGSFISSIAAGLSSGFQTIMANLSAGLIALTIGLKPFAKAISEIPLDGVVKLGLLAAMIGVITAVGFIQSILKFSLLGDPIDAFNQSLLKLSVGLLVFAKTTSKINAKKILVLSVVLKILADVQSQLLANKLVSFFAGKVDYKGFNKGIVGMAKALKKFCNEMADEKVDEKRMLTFAKILKNLAIVQHYMPRKGGWLQKIAGTTDVDLFSNSATAMVDALKEISTKTADIKNPKKLDTFLGLIKKLVEIANNMPKSGGLVQAITGSSDLEEFAKGVEKLSTSFKTMADKASEIKDGKAIDRYIGWVKALVKLTKSMPNSGGVAGFFAGDKDLGDLSDGVETMGDMFVEIDDKLKDTDIEGLSTFVTMVQTIAKAEKNISDTVKANSDKNGTFTDPLSKMVDPLKEAMIKLKDFALTFDGSFLTEAISIFDQIHSFIWTVGFRFADKKTFAYINALVDVGKGMKAVAEAVQYIQKSGLEKFNLSDIGNSKLKELTPQIGVTPVTKPVDDSADKNYFGGLAQAINSFVQSMKTVDMKALQEAKQKIELVGSIQDFKTGKFDNIKTSVSNLKEVLKQIKSLYNSAHDGGKKDKNKPLDDEQLLAIETYANKVKETIKNVSKSMTGEGGSINTKELETFSNTTSAFADALNKVGEAFKTIEESETVKNAGQKIYNAMTKIGKSSVSAFLNPIRKGKGTKKTNVVNSFGTFKTLVSDEILAIGATDGTLYQNAIKSGGYVIDGLIAGINDKSDDLLSAIKKAAKGVIKGAEITLEIASPSKVFKRIGRFTIEGYIKGVKSGKAKMIKSTTDVFKSTIKGIKQDLIKNNKTIKSLGKSFSKSIASSLGISGKKAKEAAKTRLINAAYYLYKQTDAYKEDKKALISATKRFNKNQKKINAYEEKHHLKSLKATYKKRQAATKKAKKKYEAIDNKKENKKEKAAAKKRYEAAKKAEDAIAKKYNKKAKPIAKNIDKRNDSAKTMKETQKQIKRNMINALLEFRNGIKDNIASYLDPSSLSTDIGVDFFSKFEKSSRISADRMLYNNKKNVQMVKEYQSDVQKLESLVKKGQLNASLARELKAGGISKWSEVKAYLDMNTSQLKEVNTAWKDKEKLTAAQMSREVSDKLSLVKKNTKDLEKLRKKGLGKEALQSISQMAPEEQRTYIDALLNATSTQFKAINKAYKNVDKESKKQANKVVATFASTGAGGKKALEKELNKATGTKAGKNVIDGVIEGTKSNTQRLKSEYTNLATTIIDTFNNKLGIHSPSTVFIKSSKNMADGLIKGVDKNSDKVSKVKSAFKNLGGAAYKACSKEISHADGVKVAEKFLGGLKDRLIKVKYTEFKKQGVELGWALIEGLGKGLTDKKKNKVTNTKIGKLCQKIATAFRDFFKVNSPSKVTAEIGGGLPEGLGVGIEDKGNMAIKSAKRLSANVLSVFENMNTDNISEPVLTPVVDISNVEEAADSIDSMFNDDILVNASVGFRNNQNKKNNLQPQQVVNNYNNSYEQNNYSPEPLSRIDIYRDTKSLLGQKMKGGLATT